MGADRDDEGITGAEDRRERGEALFRHPDFAGVAEQRLREYVDSVADPYAVTHRVQITSYGGSGTTALRDHLLHAGLDLPKGPDSWPFKHARVPPDPTHVPEEFRAIYVYGDPRDAVRSVFRRGIQFGHYSLLHTDSPDPDPETATRLQSLERYTEDGIDEFGLHEQFENWSTATGYAVLLLRFDSLPDTWSTVRDFLDLPDDCPPPAVLDRQIRGLDDADVVWQRLTFMYSDLIDTIDTMPPVVVHD